MNKCLLSVFCEVFLFRAQWTFHALNTAVTRETDISSDVRDLSLDVYYSLFIKNYSGILFIGELGSYISDNSKPSDHTIFTGDYNIDLLPNSYVGHVLVNFCIRHSFSPLITEVTRETEVSSTIIDHFWTNNALEYLSGVICCRITDHNIIFLTFPISTRSNSYLKSFRDHSNRCVEKFKIEFSDLLETIAQKHYTNLDEKVSDFSINLYDRYNYSCPIRTKNVTDVNARKPWLTKEIVKLLKFKQFLYRDYKNNYLPYHIFNNFRNKLTNMI